MALLTRTNLSPTMCSLMDTGSFLSPRIFNYGESATPDVNIIEGEKDYKIELAAPGLERKDFKVEVDNDMLTISTEREETSKERDLNYKRKEFSYNSFTRSFTLPENSIGDKVDAKYENGILRLSIPKKEMSTSSSKKQIKIS